MVRGQALTPHCHPSRSHRPAVGQVPRLTNGHAKGLAQLLRVNGRLGCLSLAGNDVTADGAEALGKALRGKYNDKLASLDLSANLLGAGGAAALGEALESNTALKELKLTQCGGGLECSLPGLTTAPSPPRLPPPGARQAREGATTPCPPAAGAVGTRDRGATCCLGSAWLAGRRRRCWAVSIVATD